MTCALCLRISVLSLGNRERQKNENRDEVKTKHTRRNRVRETLVPAAPKLFLNPLCFESLSKMGDITERKYCFMCGSIVSFWFFRFGPTCFSLFLSLSSCLSSLSVPLVLSLRVVSSLCLHSVSSVADRERKTLRKTHHHEHRHIT